VPRPSLSAAVAALVLASGLGALPFASAATTTTLPAGYPSPADCKTVDDGTASDGTPLILGAPVPAAPDTYAPNDEDFDIRTAAINTTPTEIIAYLKIAKLGDGPTQTNGQNVPWVGDRFVFQFNVGAKQLTYADGRTVGPLAGQANAPKQVPTNGVLTSVFDKTNSYVILKVGRAGLEAAAGVPVPDGTVLTKLLFQTTALGTKADFRADQAKAATEAQQVYTVGDNACFPPPPSKLLNAGAVRTQFTDAAAVAASLTNEAGAGLAGKTVKFTVGSKSVTAVTDTEGVAQTTIDPGLPAGTYSLVEAFAGDGSAAAVTLTTPFTVTPEVTKVTFKIVKSGQKRTVIATLKDDDGKYVVGQLLNWYVDGRKVASGRTNSSGAVTLATAKPTQTVKGDFTGVSGKYLKSSYTSKV
jgi:hypothetical protein